MMRIAIAGGPKTGKTTMSKGCENVKHTDDLIKEGWSEASEKSSLWFDDHKVLTVEGVAVPRGLEEVACKERNRQTVRQGYLSE